MRLYFIFCFLVFFALESCVSHDNFPNLSESEWTTIQLEQGDSFNLEKKRGIRYLKCLPQTGNTLVFDIVNAEKIICYRNNVEIEPSIFEDLHTIHSKRQKHFTYTIAAIPDSSTQPYLFEITFGITDTARKSFITVSTVAEIRQQKEAYLYKDRYFNFFISLLMGILFYQFITILFRFFERQQIAYLYYALVVFFLLCYNFYHFNYQLGFNLAVPFGGRFSFVTATGIVYLRFLRFFFKDEKFDRIRWIEYLVWCFLLVNALGIQKVGVDIGFYNVASNVIMLSFFYVFYLLFQLKHPLKYFFIFSILLMLLSGVWGRTVATFFPESIYDQVFIRQMLLIVELFILNTAITYQYNKEKRTQQQQVEHERNRIAADLHDDLGTGLSTIRLLGERTQLGLNNAEKSLQIQRITHQASDLIEKMSAIIWAMNTQNDTVESLTQYLRFYAFDYLDKTHNLELHFAIPDLDPSVSNGILFGKIRREVFLAFKEALHNIVKHAKATDVNISIVLKNNELNIAINDNGIGMKEMNTRGNGLNNMANRMAAIEGKFEIWNLNTKQGTSVLLTFPTGHSPKKLTKVRWFRV
jgi:signal transduction histidine kinase